jgi:hypothetical protein
MILCLKERLAYWNILLLGSGTVHMVYRFGICISAVGNIMLGFGLANIDLLI